MSFSFASDISFLMNLILFLFTVGFSVVYFSRLTRQVSPAKALMLATVRFLFITILIAALIGLKLVIIQQQERTPKAHLYLDLSSSMAEYTPSLQEKVRKLTEWQTEFGGIAWEWYSFSEDLEKFDPKDTILPDGKWTNFEKILTKEKDDPADFTVVLTDGNWNTGKDPAFFEEEIRHPIWFIPPLQQDTLPDYMLEQVSVPEFLIAGKEYNIPLRIERTVSTPSTITVLAAVKEGEKIRASYSFPAGQYVLEITLPLTIREPGNYQMRWEVIPAQEDKKMWNNRKMTTLEVLPDRYHVWFYGGPPHPDIGFFHRLFDRDSLIRFRFHVDLVRMETDSARETGRPDLIILWNGPTGFSDKHRDEEIRTLLVQENIPLWINYGTHNQQFLKTYFPDFPEVMDLGLPNAIRPVWNTIHHPLAQFLPDVQDNLRFWEEGIPMADTENLFRGNQTTIYPLLWGVSANHRGILMGTWKKGKREIWVSTFRNLRKWEASHVRIGFYPDAPATFFRMMVLFMLRSRNFSPIVIQFPSERLYTGTVIPFSITSKRLDGQSYHEGMLKASIFLRKNKVFYQEFLLSEQDEGTVSWEFTPADSGIYTIEVELLQNEIPLAKKKETFVIREEDVEKLHTGINWSELRRLNQLFAMETSPEWNEIRNNLSDLQLRGPEKIYDERTIGFSWNVWFMVMLVGLALTEWLLRRWWNLF